MSGSWTGDLERALAGKEALSTLGWGLVLVLLRLGSRLVLLVTLE